MTSVAGAGPDPDDLLIRQEIATNETIPDAVFAAAEALGVDITAERQQLIDAVDADGLEQLFETQAQSNGKTPMVMFQVWGMFYVVRPGVVEVYQLD